LDMLPAVWHTPPLNQLATNSPVGQTFLSALLIAPGGDPLGEVGRPGGFGGEEIMRKLRGGGVTLALLLGLGGPGLAAEPLDPAPRAGSSASSTGNWWTSWFGHKELPEDKKPSSPAEKPGPQPSPAETAVAIRQREYD